MIINVHTLLCWLHAANARTWKGKPQVTTNCEWGAIAHAAHTTIRQTTTTTTTGDNSKWPSCWVMGAAVAVLPRILRFDGCLR